MWGTVGESQMGGSTVVLPYSMSVIKCLLLLLLKQVSSARLGESDIQTISLKTPAPQYQPIDRKRVEYYSRDRAA